MQPKHGSRRFDWTISVGHILTIVSAIITIVTVRHEWEQSRALEQKRQANEIRAAAAQTLAKVERYEELLLAFFDDMQPVFVETSEILDDDFKYTLARDYLYKQARVARLKTFDRIRNENIETSYVNLYGYQPVVYELFREYIQKIRLDEETMFTDFLRDTEINIYEVQEQEQGYETAILGNILRETVKEHKYKYQSRISIRITCLRIFLNDIIRRDDANITENPVSTYVCPV